MLGVIVFTLLFTIFVNGNPYCQSQVFSDDGDIRLAAIIGIHETKDNKCGVISANEFQIAVAIKWAVDALNGRNQSFIPGVKIGYEIYDDCELEILSSKHITNILETSEREHCIVETNMTRVPLLGVIGTTLSQSTAAVSRLLIGTGIPVVGISATLAELSNKALYPNFIRSVPSDTIQAKVILQIAKELNWNYIVAIHTDDNYGTEGMLEFQKLAKNAGICISKVFSVSRNNPNIATEIARLLLFQVSKTAGDSIGVVYFGQSTEATDIFNTMRQGISKWHGNQNIHNIHWIMSDGVGTTLSVAASQDWLNSLLLSISPANMQLQDIQSNFLEFMLKYSDENISATWKINIIEYIKVHFNCDPVSTSNSSITLCNSSSSKFTDFRSYYHQADYISFALDAVYILVSTLKSAHNNLCSAKHGLCDELITALGNNILNSEYKPISINYRTIGQNFVPARFYTDNRHLTADLNGDYEVKGEAQYDINIAQHGKYSKVGQYKNGVLSMGSLSQYWSLPTKSWCKAVCEECFQAEELEYAYIPGDVIIVGLFPVHNAGDGYGCGDYRGMGSSYTSLLSFISSIYDLKGKTGIHFGGLILDDCYNPLRANNILNMILSGKTVLIDKDSGMPIDVSNVIAVVGAQSSGVALSILPTLTNLKIPLISYSATSADLDDRITYPYFMRTVPSDTMQAMALLEIVNLLNITHVGAINVNNNYGRKAVAKFKMLAEMKGICVEDSAELSERDSEQRIGEVISGLTTNQARYVVFFGLNAISINVLNYLATHPKSLIFIASETWGRNINIILGNRGRVARGSITLNVQTSQVADNDVHNFLSRLYPMNESSIPWFRSFWQTTFQCNIPGGFNNQYSKDCSQELSLSDKTINSIVNDQRTVQTINAVFSAGLGYKYALQDSCSNTDINTCTKPNTAFYVSKVKHMKLSTNEGTRFNIFDENSNGNIGFNINNIQKLQDGSYSYVPVGSYGNQGLELDLSDLLFYEDIGNIMPPPESHCKHILKCVNICRETTGATPDASKIETDDELVDSTEESSGDLIPAVTILVILVMILLIIIGVIIVFVVRRTNILKGMSNYSSNKEQHGLKFENVHDSGHTSTSDIHFSQVARRCSTATDPTNSTSSGVISTTQDTESDETRVNVHAPIEPKVYVPVTYLSFENGYPGVVYSTCNYRTERSSSGTSTPTYIHPVHLSSIEESSRSSSTSSHQPSTRLPNTLPIPKTRRISQNQFPSPIQDVLFYNTAADRQHTDPIHIENRSPSPDTVCTADRSRSTSKTHMPSRANVSSAERNRSPAAENVFPEQRNRSPSADNEFTTDSGHPVVNRPDYKRNTSYITGEELTPTPIPCTNNQVQLV